jgi:autotransporter-associated beta strand protein
MNISNTFRISGTIQGTGDVLKTGSGSLTLLADNTYTGATILSNGGLFISGSQPQSPAVLRVGLFGGHGFVGDIFATNASSSTISPGSGGVPAVLDIATLSCGNVIASSNTLFGFTLNGANAGTEHDQLKVAGSLTLDRPRFSPQMRFAPQISQSLILIDNDGTDPVIGMFSGLPEGALVVQSNMPFRISYAGGDGNDVSLTRIVAPSSTLSFITPQSGSMLLQGLGISNLIYTVQSASNLNTPIFWETIGTSSANRSNIYQFIDTNSGAPMRFYRVLSP